MVTGFADDLSLSFLAGDFIVAFGLAVLSVCLSDCEHGFVRREVSSAVSSSRSSAARLRLALTSATMRSISARCVWQARGMVLRVRTSGDVNAVACSAAVDSSAAVGPLASSTGMPVIMGSCVDSLSEP